MAPHDTVLLDVDGTLADTTYHHALAWARAFAAHDLTPPLWQVHRAIGMGGDKLVGAVAGDDVEERSGDGLRERWEEEYERLLPEIVLLPGARDLVLLLSGRGVRVALASSGKARFTDHVVGLLDLPEGTLAGTTSSDDAEHSKPEPDILSSALEAAGGTSAVVVGDTTYDVTAAARMGAPCVALLSGGFGRVELEDAGAVHVAGTPEELLGADWDALLAAEPSPAAREDRTPLDRSAG